jgi:anti-sigma-K factor RskA
MEAAIVVVSLDVSLDISVDPAGETPAGQPTAALLLWAWALAGFAGTARLFAHGGLRLRIFD